MSTDVTDATFQTAVIERSSVVPVVVDVWAPWCGPCRTLGPIIERVIDATEGAVELAKVNADDNPGVSATFQVQGIPAVFGLRDGAVVDSFVGAKGEREVQAFVDGLAPSAEELRITALLAAGDEASLREVLASDPGHEGAVLALAELVIADGRHDEALDLLERIPDTAAVRHLAALARRGDEAPEDPEERLGALLDRVKDDEAARQEFLDLLELLGPDDERTASWRKQLTVRLF